MTSDPRSRNPYLFSTKTCVAETLPNSMHFLLKVRLPFKVIVNLNVMRSIAPTFLVVFCRKCASQESCRVPWVHFPCVFSHIRVLRSGAIGNLHAMRPTAPWFLIFVQGKTRLAAGIPRGSHCHCQFSFVPKPGRKPNLDKGTLYRRCWVNWLSVPDKPRVALVRKGSFKTHVTPKGWDVKGGIPQNACWRLGCGEARQTLKRAQKRQPFKWTSQVVNQTPVYVCSGRAGDNERHLLFYARYEETWPTHPPNKQQTNKQTNKQTN